MDHLNEYLKNVGDIPFSERDVTIEDAAVFCVLAYADMTMDNMIRPQTLSEYQTMLESKKGDSPEKYPQRSHRALIKDAAQTKRFGSLRFRDYVSRQDISTSVLSCEFSAVTFDLTENHSFIVFRGTNKSLTGWQDDFMGTFIETEAQLNARDYLDQIISPDRRYDIGGHSKGGNLALFGILHMEKEKQAAVRRIYLCDAPGLSSAVTDISGIEKIRPLITRIVPEFSLFGRLYEMPTQSVYIIKSDAKNFRQHKITNWSIAQDRFITAKRHKLLSTILSRMTNKALGSTGQAEKIKLYKDFLASVPGGHSETADENFNFLLVDKKARKDFIKRLMSKKSVRRFVRRMIF